MTLHSATLSIAGIGIAVRSPFPLVFDEPLARFLRPELQADIRLDVRLEMDLSPQTGRLLFDGGDVWTLYDHGATLQVDCVSPAFGTAPYKRVEFDESFTHGTLTMKRAVFESGLQPLDYPLDELIVANYLARGRGVELHSCGVIDERGRGHIFAGQSGAGKTTTARLWETSSREIVSDDRVIVRYVDDRMMMFGTPWHGEAELASPTSAPLHAIYLLEQASTNEVVDMTRADAVAALFGCTFPTFHDPAGLAFTLCFLEEITTHVPVRKLRFRRDEGAVSAVLEKCD